MSIPTSVTAAFRAHVARSPDAVALSAGQTCLTYAELDRWSDALANELVSAGLQAILNFSPTILDTPEHVVVSNVDLAVELENLSYFIR